MLEFLVWYDHDVHLVWRQENSVKVTTFDVHHLVNGDVRRMARQVGGLQ